MGRSADGLRACGFCSSAAQGQGGYFPPSGSTTDALVAGRSEGPRAGLARCRAVSAFGTCRPWLADTDGALGVDAGRECSGGGRQQLNVHGRLLALWCAQHPGHRCDRGTLVQAGRVDSAVCTCVARRGHRPLAMYDRARTVGRRRELQSWNFRPRARVSPLELEPGQYTRARQCPEYNASGESPRPVRSAGDVAGGRTRGGLPRRRRRAPRPRGPVDKLP
jgi:hypothetical protein